MTLLYSILATQLILYVSVPATTVLSVRRAVARHVQLACAGIEASEKETE